MITSKDDKLFVLDTDKTTYAFRVMPTGHLEHLYYGRKIRLDSDDGISERWEFAPGNSSVYDEKNASLSLEDVRLEVSFPGKGDVREPFAEIVNCDGSFTSDFIFEKASVTKGKVREDNAAGSYGEDADVLTVTLKDTENKLTLNLVYTVFGECVL